MDVVTATALSVSIIILGLMAIVALRARAGHRLAADLVVNARAESRAVPALARTRATTRQMAA